MRAAADPPGKSEEAAELVGGGMAPAWEAINSCIVAIIMGLKSMPGRPPLGEAAAIAAARRGFCGPCCCAARARSNCYER